jgi:hypothetical protein
VKYLENYVLCRIALTFEVWLSISVGGWGKLSNFKLQRKVIRLMTLVGRVNWCRKLFKTFSRPNTIYLNFGNRK